MPQVSFLFKITLYMLLFKKKNVRLPDAENCKAPAPEPDNGKWTKEELENKYCNDWCQEKSNLPGNCEDNECWCSVLLKK